MHKDEVTGPGNDLVRPCRRFEGLVLTSSFASKDTEELEAREPGDVYFPEAVLTNRH